MFSLCWFSGLGAASEQGVTSDVDGFGYLFLTLRTIEFMYFLYYSNHINSVHQCFRLNEDGRDFSMNFCDRK